jgi:hypothetical protein
MPKIDSPETLDGLSEVEVFWLPLVSIPMPKEDGCGAGNGMFDSSTVMARIKSGVCEWGVAAVGDCADVG